MSVKEGDIVYVRCKVTRVGCGPECHPFEVRPFAKRGQDDDVDEKPWWYAVEPWLVTGEQIRKAARGAD